MDIGAVSYTHLDVYKRQLTAQPFFVRNGFEVVFTQKVELGGQVLENARMRKVLLPE